MLNTKEGDFLVCHGAKDAPEVPALPHALNWSKNNQYSGLVESL